MQLTVLIVIYRTAKSWQWGIDANPSGAKASERNTSFSIRLRFIIFKDSRALPPRARGLVTFLGARAPRLGAPWTRCPEGRPAFLTATYVTALRCWACVEIPTISGSLPFTHLRTVNTRCYSLIPGACKIYFARAIARPFVEGPLTVPPCLSPASPPVLMKYGDAREPSAGEAAGWR